MLWACCHVFRKTLWFYLNELSSGEFEVQSSLNIPGKRVWYWTIPWIVSTVSIFFFAIKWIFSFYSVQLKRHPSFKVNFQLFHHSIALSMGFSPECPRWRAWIESIGFRKYFRAQRLCEKKKERRLICDVAGGSLKLGGFLSFSGLNTQPFKALSCFQWIKTWKPKSSLKLQVSTLVFSFLLVFVSSLLNARYR